MSRYKKIKEKIGKLPKYILILLAILLVGAVLRTYQFSSWLNFESDQVRDAILVGNVLDGRSNWPIFGPTMRGSENLQGDLFHIGPMYYYFQIISGKLFGNNPDKFAYPDVLFSILTMPLFFIFLRKYFNVMAESGEKRTWIGQSISLSLTFLLSISYFMIYYSRFAWNPNLIPFFSILFLLSLLEIVLKKKMVHWLWLVAVGVAIGVGVQLHVAMLILFPATAFFVFVYLLKDDWQIWKKIAIILGVVIILNFGQIVSEFKTGFYNSKILVASVLDNGSSTKNDLADKVAINLDCHVEANMFMLSSLGPNECDSSYRKAFNKVFAKEKDANFKRDLKMPSFILKLIFGLLFSLFGYVILIYRAWKEKIKERRYFLRLVLLYVTLSFVIMFPFADDKTAEFRYFMQVFFVPFLFLGLLVDFIIHKLSRLYAIAIIAVIFTVLVISNTRPIVSTANKLSIESKADVHFAVLGEMEKMVAYLIDNSGDQKNIYLVGDRMYAAHFFQPFQYLAERKGYNINKIEDDKLLMSNSKKIFYVTNKIRDNEAQLAGYTINKYQVFGRVTIYKLNGI